MRSVSAAGAAEILVVKERADDLLLDRFFLVTSLKWTAKLRANKTDDNLLLMKINMGAGHGGKSGRWNSLYEQAEAYQFVIDQLSE